MPVKTFNVTETTNDLIKFTQRWFRKNGPDCKAVIGISGGKDSSIAAALCVKALGKDRVFGVLMPQGTQPDIQMSYDLCKYLGIDFIEVDILHACRNLKHQVRDQIGTWSAQSSINLPPRIRMATLYAVSQSINGELGLPEKFIEKIPTDGLCGHTDEDNLGFTYAELDAYLESGIKPEPDKLKRIQDLHWKNLFKFKELPCYPYRAPVYEHGEW